MPTARNDDHLVVGIRIIEDIDSEVADLKAQVKELNSQRKSEMQALKSHGHDPKVIEQMIRERKMDPIERMTFQTKLQVYRAKLGLLDGTPLGAAALKALGEKPKPATDSGRIDDPSQDPLPEVPDEPKAPQEPTDADIEKARGEGVEAARAKKPISSNPYPAEQPKLRAEWEMGWCGELGSDGMDIPESLRRKPKSDNDDKKPGKKKAA